MTLIGPPSDDSPSKGPSKLTGEGAQPRSASPGSRPRDHRLGPQVQRGRTAAARWSESGSSFDPSGTIEHRSLRLDAAKNPGGRSVGDGLLDGPSGLYKGANRWAGRGAPAAMGTAIPCSPASAKALRHSVLGVSPSTRRRSPGRFRNPLAPGAGNAPHHVFPRRRAAADRRDPGLTSPAPRRACGGSTTTVRRRRDPG